MLIFPHVFNQEKQIIFQLIKNGNIDPYVNINGCSMFEYNLHYIKKPELTQMFLKFNTVNKIKNINKAFCNACLENNFDLANTLLSYGADINTKLFGKNLLFIACEQRNLDLLKYLCLKNIKKVIIVHNNTPLIKACMDNSEDIVMTLLQYNDINLNYTDYSGKNAIFYSIKNGNYNITSALLSKGIDIFKRDEFGYNAYTYCRKICLLKGGSNFNKIKKILEKYVNYYAFIKFIINCLIKRDSLFTDYIFKFIL